MSDDKATEGLREALAELVDTFSPAEHGPIKDPAHGAEVRALGMCIGFGALMAAAEYEWRAWLAENGYPLGSEFIQGPCRAVFDRAMSIARAALAPSKIAPSEDVLKQVSKTVAEAAINGDGLWRTCSGCHETTDGQETGDYILSKAFGCILGAGCHECGGIGALWDTTDYADMAALASTPAPKIAPMVSVKALSWSPNHHNTPDSVWTGELADLRIYYAIDPEDRVFRLERGWMMSEAGRDDLGLFPTRAAAEAFANEDWHNKLAVALEPLFQAEGQEPVAWLVRYFDWQRDKVWSEWMMTRVFSQPTEHTEVQPLYTRPAETRSGQSIAAPSRAAVIEECARLVEDQEIMDGSEGQYLRPRSDGNRAGLAYATAIRALFPSATNVLTQGAKE